MLDNVDIRKALVSWLKANTTIVATLTDPNEIRELDWQGEDYSYPNIRVTCSVSPTQCNITDVDATISCFSEQKSSYQSILMQGIIAKQLHNKDGFSSGVVNFSSIRVTNLPDATQFENGVWKADVILKMKASN